MSYILHCVSYIKYHLLYRNYVSYIIICRGISLTNHLYFFAALPNFILYSLPLTNSLLQTNALPYLIKTTKKLQELPPSRVDPASAVVLLSSARKNDLLLPNNIISLPNSHKPSISSSSPYADWGSAGSTLPQETGSQTYWETFHPLVLPTVNQHFAMTILQISIVIFHMIE